MTFCFLTPSICENLVSSLHFLISLDFHTEYSFLLLFYNNPIFFSSSFIIGPAPPKGGKGPIKSAPSVSLFVQKVLILPTIRFLSFFASN